MEYNIALVSLLRAAVIAAWESVVIKSDVPSNLDNKNSPTSASSEAGAVSGADHPEKELPPSSPDAPSLGHFIRQVGAYSILLGCLALGATISAVFWSASNSRLQADLRHAQDDLEKTRLESERLKIDLARKIVRTPSSGLDQDSSSTQMSPEPSSQKTAHKPVEMGVLIETGKTAPLFGNTLRLTLLGTQFRSDPSRYVVTASAISPGHDLMTAQQVEVGAIIRYPEINGFDIQILSADALSARFLVKRNSQ